MALTLNRSILKDEGRGERGREGRGNTKNGRPRFTKPRSAHTFLSFATCNLQHFLQRGEQMDHKAKHYSWQIFKQLQAHTADRCTQIYNCKRIFIYLFLFLFPPGNILFDISPSSCDFKYNSGTRNPFNMTEPGLRDTAINRSTTVCLTHTHDANSKKDAPTLDYTVLLWRLLIEHPGDYAIT